MAGNDLTRRRLLAGIGATTAKSVLAALGSDPSGADVGDDGSATATTPGENTADHAIEPRVESAGQAS